MDKSVPQVAPVMVYLDQADWAYLQEGMADEAERKLRKLGEEGKTMFLVTYEHLYETGKLKLGYSARIQYLCGFPRTVWAQDQISKEILGLSVRGFIDEAIGQSRTHAVLNIVPLKDVNLLLMKLVAKAFYLVSKPAIWLRTALEQRVRRARVGRTKKMQMIHERYEAALFRGDIRESFQELERMGLKVNPFRGKTVEILSPLIARGASWFRLRGKLAPDGKRFDHIFNSNVMPHLPSAILTNSEQRDAVMKTWKNPEQRANVAPSLACVTAVEEAVHYSTNYNYQESDTLDSMHVTYAPMVDIFTCDKRTFAPLKKAIKQGGFPTKVLRTGRLEAVVEAVEEVFKKRRGTILAKK